MQDSKPECAQWAAHGECAKNPGYMAGACARSCVGKLPAGASAARSIEHQKQKPSPPVVDWTMPPLPEPLANAQAEHDAARDSAGAGSRLWSRCEDARPDCAALAHANLSACGEAEVMLSACPKTCRTCGYHDLVASVSKCADEHAQCGEWARMGECEANKRFMLSSCTKSCGVCEQKKTGCARRNRAAGVLPPTGLSDMFERALVDFPQFSPTAISTPHSPIEGGPWVLQFEDLLSAEEAETIVGLARPNLQRSLAGDQLSPVRTSTQYWCDDSDGCTSHPTVVELTKRMMNVTRMPLNNAEYMQILQYEPGQFYKVHHDQQTAHWTPQGVRVYTFFVYLSDVEAGGGTKFNDLDVVVTPKRGRGILWPSVIASDLLTGERRTHHEALPVERGIKHAANLWIHLYDFKSPSRAGLCPFLGQNTHGGT